MCLPPVRRHNNALQNYCERHEAFERHSIIHCSEKTDLHICCLGQRLCKLAHFWRNADDVLGGVDGHRAWWGMALSHANVSLRPDMLHVFPDWGLHMEQLLKALEGIGVPISHGTYCILDAADGLLIALQVHLYFLDLGLHALHVILKPSNKASFYSFIDTKPEMYIEVRKATHTFLKGMVPTRNF